MRIAVSDVIGKRGDGRDNKGGNSQVSTREVAGVVSTVVRRINVVGQTTEREGKRKHEVPVKKQREKRGTRQSKHDGKTVLGVVSSAVKTVNIREQRWGKVSRSQELHRKTIEEKDGRQGNKGLTVRDTRTMRERCLAGERRTVRTVS